jgi:2'-5' RNA ligase
MRLFAALVPPPEILGELEDFMAPFQARRPDLRWQRRDLLHLTLAFFGEVGEQTVDRLLPGLERAVTGHRRHELSFGGAGAFPGGAAHARVLWTGVQGDRVALGRLAAAVGAAGAEAGMPQGEHKGFRPHLTLARCRPPADIRPLIEDMAGFAGSPWTAGAVSLMRSHQTPQLHYETLKSWPLS